MQCYAGVKKSELEPSELICSDSQHILIEETQNARESISLRWKGNQSVINVSTHFCNTHTNQKSESVVIHNMVSGRDWE